MIAALAREGICSSVYNHRSPSPPCLQIEVCEGVVLASCCGLGELEFDAYGKCVTVCKVRQHSV